MRIGITTTIPVEVILAAGAEPVDLNNLFISDPHAREMVARAEFDGYPRTACAWIKGIYAATLAYEIPVVVAVTQGDCAQTHAMIETLSDLGVRIIPFAYPYDRDPELLRAQMERLAEHFGVIWEEAEEQRERLRPVRAKVAEVDRLTWQAGIVTGWENHYYQVSCSDFGGNPGRFEREVDEFLDTARRRTPAAAAAGTVRIGVAGVPTIISDLYEAIEGLGARVVLNETQRQFTMADSLDCDLLEQYRRYTYPYQLAGRLDDLRAQIELREIDGLIHYTQAFCFRQIHDLLLKRHLDLPMLSLEGENPGPLDARTRLRLEAFVETLMARKSR